MFDVIVIGAGPAGSTASKILAEISDVVLAKEEQRRIPDARSYPCTHGI